MPLIHQVSSFSRRSTLYSCITLSLIGCKTGPQGDEITTPIKTDNVFRTTQNWYVNPAWSQNAEASGGANVAHHSTAVWLQKLGDVEATYLDALEGVIPRREGGTPHNSLALLDHLNAAESQSNALIQIVLNNLPGKGCTTVLNEYELTPDTEGMARYQEHFIDKIADALAAYPNLPVAIILEPVSLPHLVKYHDEWRCQEVNNQTSYGYTNAIRYAINTLSKLENVHVYLDIEGSNELGWDDDLEIVSLFYQGVITGFDNKLHTQAKTLGIEIEAKDGATGRYLDIEEIFLEPPTPETGDTSPPGYKKLAGFATNVADYVPLDEPYLGPPELPATDQPLYSAYFYDWNPRFDEHGFSEDWLEAIRDLNSDSPSSTQHLGMIIDTSRNGWGQAHTALQDSDVTQVASAVNQFRIDQREHRKNWCNQPGGLGKRPQAAPEDKPWVDAYLWVKPPGESDGTSDPNFIVDPNQSPYKTEVMCDPRELSRFAQEADSTVDLNLGTGAMENTPHKNQWFAEGFKVYLENAWPPICEGAGDRCE